MLNLTSTAVESDPLRDQLRGLDWWLFNCSRVLAYIDKCLAYIKAIQIYLLRGSRTSWTECFGNKFQRCEPATIISFCIDLCISNSISNNFALICGHFTHCLRFVFPLQVCVESICSTKDKSLPGSVSFLDSFLFARLVCGSTRDLRLETLDGQTDRQLDASRSTFHVPRLKLDHLWLPQSSSATPSWRSHIPMYDMWLGIGHCWAARRSPNVAISCQKTNICQCR